MKAKNKCKLTQMLVKRLKTTAGRPVLVWDTLCYGLVFCVQPSGHRSFRFFYSIRGRPKWYHIGWVYLKDAREIGFGLRAAIARGRDPAVERQSASSITFADLAARYLEVAKKKNKSWKQADALVKKYLIPKWGKRDAKSITVGDVSLMMSKIKAPISANQTVAAASAIFIWAMKPAQGLVTTNPCKGVERNPVVARERVLSDSEVALFWAEFSRLDLIRSAALKTLLLTGQRLNEVCCMRTEHIKDGWWELPGRPVPELKWPGVKNARSHRVWLSDAVRGIISNANNAGFVFGKAVTGIDAAMRTICERLNCERTTPHDLRRTFGSTVTRLGFGRQAMDRLLNHSDKGTMAAVYDRHSYANEDRRIMERVAQHIVTIAAGREGDTVVFARFPGAEPS
jgi:integrase